MTSKMNALELVNQALERDELDKLILGTPEYRYLPARSPSPWNTDIALILSVLYDWIYSNPIVGEKKMESALTHIVQMPQGIIPVALCILFEVVRNSNNRGVRLPLDELSQKLHNSILENKSRLQMDRRGPAIQWRDGMLGELRRLSKNSKKRGGPCFWEEI